LFEPGVLKLLDGAYKCSMCETVMEQLSYQKYRIKLVGCDDMTEFDITLNEKEYELLEEIERLSEDASKNQCMPKLYVWKK
jgi:hypothetical protein